MNLNLKMTGDKKFVYFTKDTKVFMTSPLEVNESVIQDFLHCVPKKREHQTFRDNFVES